jgi:hypothetical protein
MTEYHSFVSRSIGGCCKYGLVAGCNYQLLLLHSFVQEAGAVDFFALIIGSINNWAIGMPLLDSLTNRFGGLIDSVIHGSKSPSTRLFIP